MDTGLEAVKTVSTKVFHKAGGFIGNKIANAVTKPNYKNIVKPDENSGNVEGISIPPGKRDEILNKLRKFFIKNGTL